MPRLTLQTLSVLSAFLGEPGKPKYGLELGRAAGLPSGTVYPLLARLEKAGWLSSDLEDIDERVAGRRRRRYYRLTGDGARLAEQQIASTIGRLSAGEAPTNEREGRPQPKVGLP